VRGHKREESQEGGVRDHKGEESQEGGVRGHKGEESQKGGPQGRSHKRELESHYQHTDYVLQFRLQLTLPPLHCCEY
jgi:hypothetical protein